MTENPQRNEDIRWILWELHFDEVIQDANENPVVVVDLQINKPFVIYQAKEILKETK